jgi:CxxC motif-containing protein (DUF1111 family)
MCRHCGSWRSFLVILRGVVLFSGALALEAGQAIGQSAEEPDGRELFVREWIPRDSPSKGDGLGPMFNDSSCVACHNQGGVGGSGPHAKNAQIVSAIVSDFESIIGDKGNSKARKPEDQKAAVNQLRKKLTELHPGFATARSVVLHRFSTDPNYAAFRGKLLGIEESATRLGFSGQGFGSVGFDEQGVRRELVAILTASQLSDLNRARTEAMSGTLSGNPFVPRNNATENNFTILISERNTIALFGSGKIDTIPDDVLLAAAEKSHGDFPEIKGRVARLKDGRIGRFGWKAQKSRLSDFVLTACAVELGLNVPEQPQSSLPHKPDYQPTGLDLNEQECLALISYVSGLRQPAERKPIDAIDDEYVAGGRELFASIGCAACHLPQLGEVAGIYSDLLLHDMGSLLGDSGSYSGFAPNSTEEEELLDPLPLAKSSKKPKTTKEKEAEPIGARRQEWRTPPLWGLRDSAPYLHDGRAATIEHAIVLHGGEGENSARRFFRLKPAERLQLTLFLGSLSAPQ